MSDQRSRMTRSHRRRLSSHLGDGLVLLVGAPEVVRNGDVTYPYRQDSSFLWLSGVEAPGHALLLDCRRKEEVLFVPRLTQKHAVWTGHIPSMAQARRTTGFAEVQPADSLARELRRRVGQRGTVLHVTRRAAALVGRAVPRARLERRPLEDALATLRIVKDADEVALLAAASRATAEGFRAAMRVARAGLFEYQVQAELERGFRMAGAAGVGFDSIVASGRNAAILHYHDNSARLRTGELLLIDAGAEWHGYTADVSRTIPISARFGPRQRALYDIVLEVQERCIAAVRPGLPSLDLQRLAETGIAEGLRHLGLLRGDTDELVTTEAVRMFLPHGIGHPLGLDVHDVTGGRDRQIRRRRAIKLRFRAVLEAGFVITIEPGVYFIPALLDDLELRRKHRGRVDFARAEKWLPVGGIRIEDDVLVRASGRPLNLTHIPKRPAAVEEACQS